MQLKDCIHFYLGAKAKRFPEGAIVYITLWQLEQFDLQHCQLMPILRRLESMTEVEVVKLFSIKRQAEPEKIIRVGHEGGFIQIEFVQHGEYNSDYQDLITMYPGQFYYLIKEGFDLFGLIESGEAIDQETLKKEP